ncbi:hypothetical protein, partial [Rhizobacter sp. LjRoot28]|uniref:hypothetical protein n=1 Tax=Rhizobacter sp. LjRoot28 TaxID=3342309 RepID=UPI003F4F48F0
IAERLASALLTAFRSVQQDDDCGILFYRLSTTALPFLRFAPLRSGLLPSRAAISEVHDCSTISGLCNRTVTHC